MTIGSSPRPIATGVRDADWAPNGELAIVHDLGNDRDRLEFPELPSFLGDDEQKRQLLELNLVFLKACQNDVDRRYRTAQSAIPRLILRATAAA